VHGLLCNGNITRTRNVSEYMLVLALCPVTSYFHYYAISCTLFICVSLLLHLCYSVFVTFRVSRRRGEMYSGHARLCVCLSLAAFPHYCTDPYVILRHGRGFSLVVQCWADLQSVHGIRCYDSIARTRNVSECPALALRLV